MGIILDGNFPGGNCPSGSYPGWGFSGWELCGWELSWVGVILGGMFWGGSYLGWAFSLVGVSEWELSGGNHLSGSFPGGSFHVTVFRYSCLDIYNLTFKLNFVFVIFKVFYLREILFKSVKHEIYY